MKRFAMTISLAACLVFLLGASSMAANSVFIESKSVLPSATGVNLGIFVTNDAQITGFTMPIELRTLTGGAYIAGAAGWTRGINPAGRMQNSPLGPGYAVPASVTNRTFATPVAPTGCTRPADALFSWNTAVANPDAISPDAFFLATVSQGDPGVGDSIALDPGTDGAVPSYKVTFNVQAAQGTFIFDTTCIAPANHLSFVDRATSQAVAPSFTAGIITVEIPPNQCPVVTVDNAVVNATVGSAANNDADAVDPEEDSPITFYLASGPGSVDPVSGAWSYTPQSCSDVGSFQVCIGAFDPGKNPQTCPNTACFTLNVSPAPLTVQPVPDISVHWSAPDVGVQINASGGCPPYTYSIESGPGSISSSGFYTFDPSCSDVGLSTAAEMSGGISSASAASPQTIYIVIIIIVDGNGNVVEIDIIIIVTNMAPPSGSMGPTLAQQGVDSPVTLGLAMQADGDSLTYTYVGGLPVAWNPTVVGNVLHATRPSGDGNTYTVQYSATDGCATANSSFDYIFENPCVKVVDDSGNAYGCALNGTLQTVCLVAEPGAIPGDAGGYDFLICYDQSGLTFLGASGGPAGWEYFTYRTGMFGGNCSGGCPDGFVRLVAVADMNNGVAVDPVHFNLDGESLACMTFFVTSNRNFINSCFHVGFCSYDCGDNVISNVSGNITWTPTDGVTYGPDYTCAGHSKPGHELVPAISYCPGAICVCEPLDDRGDINLNGIANEVGDAVLYTNYFIYGSSVWNPTWMQVQILASDINDDGIVLTVADLIYLIRIITGDAVPFPKGTGNGSPKLAPYANTVDVSSDVANGAVTVRTNSSVDLGAAMLVFRYSGVTVGAPTLANNSGLQIRSHAENGELRVLVSGSVEAAAARLGAGANNLITIPVNGDGSIELVESQFSDYNGALLQVNAASAAVPTEYALKQNYPNPFNAGTIIPITLVGDSHYDLTIYNVAGQVVRTFAGNGSGNMTIAWDGRAENGTSVASGMYFYRLTTPAFSATKKMVLLK